MVRTRTFIAVVVGLLAFAFTAKGQTPPPAPALVEPAAGAALVQPITIAWNDVVDPDGPIGSYSWQVGTSSTFGVVIAAGFTNQLSDDLPPQTYDRVSGLPNGTYFWRVKATQMVGGAVFALDSPWSTVRSFTVTGLGAAPATPAITSPSTGSLFHVREFFDIKWTAVPGAQYYLLEADDEPSFSHPLTLTLDSMQFGMQYHAGWGNPLPNVYYRVRAVSSGNVRGLPSATLNVKISDTAPVPPAPTPLTPSGTTASLPITFDWSDTANPQIPGYDLDIDDEPQFLGTIGVLFIANVSRSDYMVATDLPPGNYFWRVRAIHGSTYGPWSTGRSFTVVAGPPTPPGLGLFTLIAEPGAVNGGNPTQARVILNMPAPAGGVTVKLASDLPHAQMPNTVTFPAGATDAIVGPITTVPVPAAVVGDIRAGFAGEERESGLALFPLLWDLSLSDEEVIGGDTVTGTVTLLNPAPPGGIHVKLVSSDTDLVTPPADIFIPAGEMGATFDIPTVPVFKPVHVVIDAGTPFENYRAPGAGLMLMPLGTPAPPPSLSELTLQSSSILAGGGTTGTLTLTSPAPPGGAAVWLNGSMEGEVITPIGGVTIPAGSLSATFPITAPQVNAAHYVLIQARYGTTDGTQGKLLEIKPGPAGPPKLLASDVRSRSIIGGTSTLGTVALVTPAPAGGGVVTLTSSNPAVAQVPASVSIAPGTSANSFTITTSPVITGASVQIDATAGGVTKSFFINIGPDPAAPPALLSVTLSVGGVTGGTSVPGTVFLNGVAPAGGAFVTLATSNPSAAQVPAVVSVPAGQGFANFTVTTFPVSSTTQVTITGFYGGSTQSANLTVQSGSSQPQTPGTPSLVSPANDATPVQPVALDWSDASSAASYEIQIDDSSAFSAPLVRSLTSTTSQTSVSGLSAVQHWWRVRARNSAGVAGNWSAVRRFTPQAAPAAASLSAVSVSPSSVVGGGPSQGTVSLTSGAPAGGAVVSLTSSNPAVAAVPSSITVGASGTSATFSVTTTAVTTSTGVTLTAVYAGVTRTTTLTVTPQPAPASLSSVNLSPTTVTGGATSQGTAMLTAAAPAGGAVITLSSSNPAAATVPPSVTVNAGASSAGFTVTSKTVTTSTTVTITATYNSVQRTVTLTVNPAPTGPLPAPSIVSPGSDARFQFGQLITFDWTDVTGAAGYTLQIDDRDSFSAPLILTQTTTASTFSTSGLARADMWWRVRANDASGSPGAWSAPRRFRVQ